MDAVVLSLFHFCELHGPSVVSCTQRFCPSTKPDSYQALLGSTSENVSGNNSESSHRGRSSSACLACDSVVESFAEVSRDSTGFVTTDEDGSVYFTRSELWDPALKKDIKHACVRCLSCESSPNESKEGPFFFVEDGRLAVLAVPFFLADSQARGFTRFFALSFMSRDRHLPLHHWLWLTDQLEQIIRDLKDRAKAVYQSEQAECDTRVARLARLPQGRGKATRSLGDLTGEKRIFAELHDSFVWILKTCHERFYVIPEQPLMNMLHDSTDPAVTSGRENKTLSDSFPVVAPEADDLIFQSLPLILGIDDMKMILEHLTAGGQVQLEPATAEGGGQLRAVAFLLVSLLPAWMVDLVLDSRKVYLLTSASKSSPTNRPGIVRVIFSDTGVSVTTLGPSSTHEEKPPVSVGLSSSSKGSSSSFTSNPTAMPARGCPAYVRRLIVIATDPSLPKETVPLAIKSLVTEFALKARVFASISKAASEEQALMQVGLTESDRPMMRFWSQRLDNDLMILRALRLRETKPLPWIFCDLICPRPFVMATPLSPPSDVKEALGRVHQQIQNAVDSRAKNLQVSPCPVKLVAVSKLKASDVILEAYACGQKDFGENYVQELVGKASEEKVLELAPDIRWHFIGHLQTNKVNKLISAPGLFMVQSVDSIKLATALNKAWDKKIQEAKRETENSSSGVSSRLKVLAQFNTSGEENKSGADPKEAVELCGFILRECSSLELVGIMTIGSFGYDTTQGPNPDFLRLMEIRQEVTTALSLDEDALEVSMGMSGDFQQAIELGSTIVRVGSSIFGARPAKSPAATSPTV
ncbi:unnamed protein product [Cyprideis torosa]|uniref:Pyridoxal phosphate homeostasis protein n=1 Tax=Cyprideis torosa TaxID=163714 RepID=A0A7R8ZLS9_9CRUS|nr:unnamed protein product [Cyprideis torosa]CAG0887375.1 unnamed protein product [Cyprideis torosa]